MARDCPCGCGRKLGFMDRGIAKKVAAFDERLDFLSPFVSGVDGKFEEDEAQARLAFFSAGKDIRDSLIAVLHGADARIVDRVDLNSWHTEALRIETEFKVLAYQAHTRGEL